ncbi:MAG TPA: hypothetical protein VGZ32_17095 [Actinocrinis sp.]|jgi:hypothetical protein|uniref:hypothetical protein n=1 Tax=Actinocrinis sp. TaxID=1920516 RepID=UPI002DDCF069|nr:hypothetical protein [Actinocrinis sp.]HEV3172070.1 hypothetical protein [Actinocrinis sp.]
MRKHIYLGAGATALALLTAVAAGPASAAGGDELTAGGANVAVGDVISATLSSPNATFSTSSGNISCTASSFSSTDATNPAEGTAEATETVHTLAFSSCTSTIFGTVSVKSVGLTAGTAPLATVADEPSDNPVDLNVSPSVKVVLNTILGSVTCIYSGPVAGVVSNAADTITFTGQTVAKAPGSSALCPSTGTFTATYGNVVDQSITGTPAITVN